MLVARDAVLKLGYLDLWRAYRGATLHVRELEAGELDANLERRTDGRASWQFGSKPRDDAEARTRRCRPSAVSPCATGTSCTPMRS